MIAPGSGKNQIKVSAIEIMNHRWQLAVQLPLSQTTDLCRAQTSFCLQRVIGVNQEKWWGIKTLSVVVSPAGMVSLQMGIMSEEARRTNHHGGKPKLKKKCRHKK